MLVLVIENKKKLASGCDVGHKYVPEASGQDELPRDPFEQVQTRVRPAREKGELLLEILTMRMTVVLTGEMFRGSEDQPECSRLQSLLRQPKVFGRCRRGANLDDKDNHVDPYDHKGQYYQEI